MSEKKLTPAEAWEHVRALWPDANHIAKEGESFGLRIGKAWGQSPEGLVAIDWPSGVDRWPPIEKPRRPAKMPEDFGRRAWFRDYETDLWQDGWVCGFCNTERHQWVDSSRTGWVYCEVECDEPVQPANEPEPEWITPTEEHIGQVVQVRNQPDHNWMFCTLANVDTGCSHPFLSTDDCGYRYARIRNPKYVAPQS